MTTLQGIPAERGSEPPALHPERTISDDMNWTAGQPFIPETGKSYELAYGKILYDNEERAVTKRVRADGPTPYDWFDLDESMPLDPALHPFEIKGFRLID